MEKGGQLLLSIRRSVVRRSRAGRDDLVTLPRARRVTKEKGRSIAHDRNITTKMHTESAKSTVLPRTSKCHRCIDMHVSQAAPTLLKRLC
jgi:hypothetical protein